MVVVVVVRSLALHYTILLPSGPSDTVPVCRKPPIQFIKFLEVLNLCHCLLSRLIFSAQPLPNATVMEELVVHLTPNPNSMSYGL